MVFTNSVFEKLCFLKHYRNSASENTAVARKNLCIKVVIQSRHWQGKLCMQCWRTFVPSSPTCSRMLHVRFCHIYVYGEGHSSSSSDKCLMHLSSRLSRFQSFLSLTIPSERSPFLYLRSCPIAAQVFFLSTSWTVLAIRYHQRFQLSTLDNGRW